jgi:hypothetical protein
LLWKINSPKIKLKMLKLRKNDFLRKASFLEVQNPKTIIIVDINKSKDSLKHYLSLLFL